MTARDLGKPVVLSLPDGEVLGTLVGYTYAGKPTADVMVDGKVFMYVPLEQVRLVDDDAGTAE